jgi:hypothetical protein
MPSMNANKTWMEEASVISRYTSDMTVWFIGYLRSPKTATFTFRLDTNVNSVLYLSTDEKPENKVQIANSSSIQSNEIVLINNTKLVKNILYKYMFINVLI